MLKDLTADLAAALISSLFSRPKSQVAATKGGYTTTHTIAILANIMSPPPPLPSQRALLPPLHCYRRCYPGLATAFTVTQKPTANIA